MSSKRKFCDHCKEFVTLRTFRLHADLYSIRASEAVYSSEEEEISHGDSEDFHVDHLAAGEAACALEVIDGQENETSSGTKFFFLRFGSACEFLWLNFRTAPYFIIRAVRCV